MPKEKLNIRLPTDPKDSQPDRYDYWGYIVAAAILLPLGWWLKSTDALHLKDFFAMFVGY